jgi:hypothetical protein
VEFPSFLHGLFFSPTRAKLGILAVIVAYIGGGIVLPSYRRGI